MLYRNYILHCVSVSITSCNSGLTFARISVQKTPSPASPPNYTPVPSPHDGLPSLTGDRNVTVDLPTFPAARRRPRIPPRPADTSTQSPIT